MPQVGGTVLLADPRGYCAGVDRAVITVEKALDLYGAPVYVRKQIVHNVHVVRRLEREGAVFVDEVDEVPEGAHVVFSAHGVSPAVVQAAGERRLQAIDATCPLVTKVHREAVRFARDDFHILLIGHHGHEEVEGTAGEAPERGNAEGRSGRTQGQRTRLLTRPVCGGARSPVARTAVAPRRTGGEANSAAGRVADVARRAAAGQRSATDSRAGAQPRARRHRGAGHPRRI